MSPRLMRRLHGDMFIITAVHYHLAVITVYMRPRAMHGRRAQSSISILSITHVSELKTGYRYSLQERNSYRSLSLSLYVHQLDL